MSATTELKESASAKRTPLDIAKKTWQYPLILFIANLFSSAFPILAILVLFGIGFSFFYTFQTGVNIFKKKEQGLMKHFIPGVILNSLMLLANGFLIYVFFTK